MIDFKKVTFDGIIVGIYGTLIFALLLLLGYITIFAIAKEACK